MDFIDVTCDASKCEKSNDCIFLFLWSLVKKLVSISSLVEINFVPNIIHSGSDNLI